ncbi:MAG TPA: ABC transporter permease [Pyrinomonadaceae bacterium]|nr:ABC transporter permease [Pyrinomonadaceae bacterium]
MDTVFKDIRYAARSLRRTPAFTAVAVITLALGIGANTAIFSVINGVLLRPLPYPESQDLMFVSERDQQMRRLALAWPNYLDWRAQNQVFENVGVYNRDSYNLTNAGEAQRLFAGQVSADLFPTLRVNPVLGRLFHHDEDQPGGPLVVVLSYGLWQRTFGGDANIINRAITLSDRPYTVIGVMPQGFDFPARADIWVSAGQLSAGWQHRNNHPGLYAVARLKQNVTIAQAQADLDRIAVSLEAEYPEWNRGHGIAVSSLLENTVGDIGKSLWILFAAALFVLAVACTNVANLMLVRAAARAREFNIRTALGASRFRVARQLLVESLLIALVGSAAGVLVARWLTSALVTTAATSLPRAAEIGLDGRVLLFTAACAGITGLLFGLLPAWRSGRLVPQQALTESGRGSGSARRQAQNVFAICQVALALILLVGAGLLLRSFYQLSQVNPGFGHENVLSFIVSLPQSKYRTIEQRTDFYSRLLERLNASPGINSASVASGLPFGGSSWRTGFVAEGQPIPAANDTPQLEAYAVGPDYFRTMEIPLRAGRFFTEQDNRQHLAGRDLSKFDDGARQVLGLNAIVIDEEFARRYWPNENAVGKRIRLAPVDQGSPFLTVVGVVGRVHMDRLNVASNRVQGYLSYLQFPLPDTAVVIKSPLDVAQLTALARAEVSAVDPQQPIFNIRTLDRIRYESVAPERLNMTLMSLFAVLALMLAAVGIYGVISYAASQRTHEIGIRMALGARPRDVLSLVARQGITLALIGVGVGLVGAFLLTRLMSQMLFRVSATDAITFICVPLFLILVAAIACYIPARRATKVDPLEALRYE